LKRTWHRKQQLVGYLFIAPNLTGVLVFFILPALFSIVLVFTDWNFANRNSFNFIGLENFKRMFNDDAFRISVKNTLIFILSVPVMVFLAFLLAVALNNSVYLKKTLRAMYFMPYITSGVAVAFVWMVLFEPYQGPINSFLKSVGVENPPGWLASPATAMYSIDIIWIWLMVGYKMVIYLAALQEIPEELKEAARIDGANVFQVIRYVTIPLVSPTTLLLMITSFIGTIKHFGIIQALTEGGPGQATMVMAQLIYRAAFRYYEMGYAATISWVLFMAVLLITLLQWYTQKKWVYY